MRESCLVLRDGKGPFFVRGLAIDERTVPKKGERAWKLTFLATNKDTGE
jgi:hypothetical protein